MDFARQRALLLGAEIQGLHQFVHKHYQERRITFHEDKLFRLKCLVDEYQLDLLGKEMLRINQFMWMEKEATPLLQRLKISFCSMEKYVVDNEDELFLFLPRIYSIKNLLVTMGEEE